MPEVNIDLLVKDALTGVVSRLEQLLGRESEALCTALAFLAAGAEAELLVRLPLDNPTFVVNTRAFIERMAHTMVKKVLDSRGPSGIIPPEIQGSDEPPTK